MDEQTRHILKGHLVATKALSSAMEKAEKSNAEAHWRYVGFRDYMQKYQYIFTEVAKLVEITAPIGIWDMANVKSSMDTVGLVQTEYYDAVYSNTLILSAFLENEIGTKQDEIRALSDFFQVSLRKVIFEEPRTERDVQNAVEQLLVGRGLSRGVDYEREKGRVKVSIKETVPDFIVRRLSLAVEVKLSRDKNASRAIVDEINADIQAYGKAYAAMIFLVYDLGSIQDEGEFKQGLVSSENNIHVVVVKH